MLRHVLPYKNNGIYSAIVLINLIVNDRLQAPLSAVFFNDIQMSRYSLLKFYLVEGNWQSNNQSPFA